MFSNIAKSTSREIFRKGVLIRNISKTSTSSINEATRQPQTNQTKYASRWTRLRKHSNSRALSTVKATIAPKTVTMATKEERRDFMSVFPDLVRDLTDDIEYPDIPLVTKRFAKVLQYNVPLGKKIRGLTTVASYKLIESPENLTDANIRLAQILGWCVELLHTSFLINDDIMDESETRRGSPCWHLVEDVGMQAINDALLIENGVYMLVKKYFFNHHCYVPVMELFHDIIMKTAMGQSLDTLCMKDGMPQLDSFTMNKYNSIVKYKTAYYSCQLPVALAMYLSGRYDPELHRQATTILLEMGHYFQVQDDFLDCFGDPSTTGKEGTDIQDGKCSWLAVLALQRSSPSQRRLFEQNYGKPNPECVAAIRTLYEDLGIPNIYAIYEEETYNLIRTHVQQTSQGLPHKLFLKFLDSVYRRDA